MQDYKITVIIPVYKAANTIEKCARSLFGQTMTEGVEFLFIDDGTPDDSIKILEQVFLSFPDLKENMRIVLNPQNFGVSQTRKKGIQEARGEYIAWVDSDDWVEPNMIEQMWKATQGGKVDVVVQNVYLDSFDGTKYKNSREWKLYACECPKKALMKYHTDKHVPWGLPFQMSRRYLIQEASNKVYDVNYSEDTIMLIYLFAMAKSCVWLEKPLYHYVSVNNSDSLTHRAYQTKEEWSRQVININRITEYLLSKDKKGYSLAVSYIKWLWKSRFAGAFDNSWSYWKEYYECYRDILYFSTGSITATSKIKEWLLYNVYPLYWYKIGRNIFPNKKMF